jgi:hypothetical protein
MSATEVLKAGFMPHGIVWHSLQAAVRSISAFSDTA